jgi:hypothetical protein
MKLMAVVLFGLAALTASSPAAAQYRHGSPRGGGGGPEFHREMPVYPRGPRGGQPGGPMGGPFGPPMVRPGPDSLGADWGPQQNEAFAGVRQRRYVPLGQAIDEIRRRTPGEQLDAGLEQWGGRPAYRIRWATPNGRRIDYMVDAETGAILGADGR